MQPATAPALLPPKRIPRIRIAFRWLRTLPDCWERNITDIGMDNFGVTRIRAIAAIKALTVVVFTRKYPIMIPGINRANRPQVATMIKFKKPVVTGTKNSSPQKAAV